MSKYLKIILISLALTKTSAFAQSSLVVDKPYEPNAFQAPGVERVGSVPLPAKDNTNFFDPTFGKIDSIDRNNQPKRSKRIFETTAIPTRVLYLNGENISSVRNQELENVNVKIDGNGNIFIEAPQYEVSSEQSYHPLLPSELPRFKKENGMEKPSLPQGVYSKETGKPAESSVEPASQGNAKIPPVGIDGVQTKPTSPNSPN